MSKQYSNFSEFYPFYLNQHKNKTCRRLHFVGSFLIVSLIAYAVLFSHYLSLWLIPVIGYGFAWIGHVAFERNKPATFIYPIYSLMGDWVMFKDILLGKIKF